MATNQTTTTTDTAAAGQPSMLHGHAQYVAGAVSSALGYESGEATKKEAIEEMRAAKSDTPTSSDPDSLLSKAEGVLGSAVNCEGMKEDAAASGSTTTTSKTSTTTAGTTTTGGGVGEHLV